MKWNSCVSHGQIGWLCRVRELLTEPIKRRQTCSHKNTSGRRKIGGSRFLFFVYGEGRCRAVETVSFGFLRVALFSSGTVPFYPGDKTVPAGSQNSLFDLAIKTRNRACLVNKRESKRDARQSSKLGVRGSRVNTSSPAAPRFSELRAARHNKRSAIKLSSSPFSVYLPRYQPPAMLLFIPYNVAIKRIYQVIKRIALDPRVKPTVRTGMNPFGRE